MAAVATTIKVAYQLKLNNGVSPSGTIKTLTIPLGRSINKNTANNDKALAIANAVGHILSKTVYMLVRTDTSGIENE